MNDFVSQSVFRINESLERIQNCMRQLSPQQIWNQPNKNSNSIGNLVLHLSGNIKQYVYATLGQNEDDRNRALEFELQTKINPDHLIKSLNDTVSQAIEVLLTLNSEDLSRDYMVQGFKLSGVGIVLHVVEHLSYHTGQIALLTKLELNADLGFYKGVDLD
jgi:uncharacterized damage-inducible protein DinB